MKRLALLGFTIALLWSVVAFGQSTKPDDPATQDTSKMSSQEKGDKAGSQTVTGCLQKGDEKDEFSITGEDGKTWGLRSSNVKLEEHVGHKVTVTGKATEEGKAEAKKEKKEGELEKAAQKEEYGDIRVTSLKMVSDSCPK